MSVLWLLMHPRNPIDLWIIALRVPVNIHHKVICSLTNPRQHLYIFCVLDLNQFLEVIKREKTDSGVHPFPFDC